MMSNPPQGSKADAALAQLELEDEFDEFENDEWSKNDTANIADEELWETTWDEDGAGDDDFSRKLKQELMSRGAE
jgi:hypothetical protein